LANVAPSASMNPLPAQIAAVFGRTARRVSKTTATAARVRAAKEQSGGVARAAAIDGGEWTGAGSAPVAGGARLQAAPRRDRDLSPAPARGGLAFAALVSLAVHAAIVAAAALSLGAPQPTGKPDAFAVEWIASTGEAAPAPATDADLAYATRAPRDDANPADATPSPPPDAATPAKAPDAGASAAPKAVDAANETAPTPPAAPAQDPATDEAPAAAAAAPPPLQAPAAPPEADFAVAAAAPQLEPRSLEPKPPAAPPATPRATARFKPSSPMTGARAASAPAPAHGAAELAAYRNALLAKIWSAARYPEAARKRGATGVATVRFALDGVGAVTLADLAQSSGDRALDDAALAAVRRASPLPPPPAGAPRAYSAPIRFELR
jgi:periplasmic protein TonB